MERASCLFSEDHFTLFSGAVFEAEAVGHVSHKIRQLPFVCLLETYSDDWYVIVLSKRPPKVRVSTVVAPRREGVFSELHPRIYYLSGPLPPPLVFWLQRSTSGGENYGLAQELANSL